MAKRKTNKSKSSSTARGPIIKRLAKWTGTLGVWTLIIGLFAAGWFYTDLPDVSENLAPSRQPTLWVLDKNGNELATVGDLYGIPIKLTDLPPALPQAILATEDRRFYDHFGVDPIGLARAAFNNFRAGRVVQGGSTITQQVAKNLFLSPERTYKRKIQEVMLALWLEHHFSKDQILELYMNRVYLGAGTYGVDAAARKYFGTSSREINLWQSAMIAGLLKAPSRFNPHNSQERADGRTRVVLSNMVNAGYITDAEAKNARSVSGRGGLSRPGREAPYFVDWVLDQVRDYVGARDRDLIVRTTLDASVQKSAEAALTAALKKSGKTKNISEGAVVVMSPDGAVRAMVGGRNYSKSQFNRATQAQRQPGSAFKPIVYLAGLRAGMSPTDVIEDAPVKVGKWQPNNFNGKFVGNVTITDALARSINTVAVRVTMKAGVGRVAKTARQLGIDPGPKPDASIALGTAETTLLDLTAAYAPLANGGSGVVPFGIEEIRDGGGEIFYRRSGSGPGQVIEPHLVGPMNKMMQTVIARGTGKAAQIGRPAGGKTGTSQAYRDAWFVGYTPSLVAGVWVGNDGGQSMKRVTGGSVPARVWGDVMKSAHLGIVSQNLPNPTDNRGFLDRLFTTIEDVKQEASKVITKTEPSSSNPGSSAGVFDDRN
jgi:penicillin-binding protein 1A